MRTTGNTVLITGGATGIGFALAEAFVNKGNEVLICGRREDKLAEAKNKLPGLRTIKCDISKAEDRECLLHWAVTTFSNLNVLINNAGIQREIDFKRGTADLLGGDDEIEINLQAPVQLSALFIPHLMKQKESAIVNISSGLVFVPVAIMPIYCATKAAIHSFSMSLRHQLRDTSIKVFEIIAPTTDTELDKGARAKRGQVDQGVKPDVVVTATMEALEKDNFEIAIGQAQFLQDGSRKDPEGIFKRINSR
ncbi:MAG TPA: SDR family oxidoreductase [Terriglobales bacterium]|nr:SDR family oxidoreductase [Terriglobales bacterium]